MMRADHLPLLARSFFVLAIVSTILNGAPFWLKRIGVVDRQLYREYHDRFQSRTLVYGSAEERREALRAFASRVYQTPGLQKAFKLCKDGAFILFVLVSFVLWIRQARQGAVSLPGWAWAVLLFLAAASILSFVRYGSMMTLAGIRSFLFVFVAMVGFWAATRDDFDFLASSLAGLSLLHIAMTPVELWRGMDLFRGSFMNLFLAGRLVGTMLLPTSLGLLSVIIFLFYIIYKKPPRHEVALFCVTTSLVLLSASGTAFFLLLAATIFWLIRRYRWRSRFGKIALPAMLSILVMILLFPRISGRPDIYDSVWGRLVIVEEQIAGSSAAELIIGKGLGAGTNAAANLFMDWQHQQPKAYGSGVIFVADSTPLVMLSQVGLIGLIGFCLLVGWAAWRDREALPLYLVIVLGGMTLNVTEMFPVNFILGLILARSFSPIHYIPR